MKNERFTVKRTMFAKLFGAKHPYQSRFNIMDWDWIGRKKRFKIKRTMFAKLFGVKFF